MSTAATVINFTSGAAEYYNSHWPPHRRSGTAYIAIELSLFVFLFIIAQVIILETNGFATLKLLILMENIPTI